VAAEALGLGDLGALFGDAPAAETFTEIETSREVTAEAPRRPVGVSVEDLASLLDVPRRERPAEPQRANERVVAASWLVVPEEQWGWSELRDYIVVESERRFGPTPRNPAKEAGIVRSFMDRWGGLAVPIAKRAFTAHEGVWRGAPVRIERFSKACDDWFAQQVAAEVAQGSP
jgi:hypothetical protein